MPKRWAERVHTERVAVMGEALEEVYSELQAEVLDLHRRLDLFVDLFDNAGRVELLNRSAAYVFGVVQDLLWDDIVLRISRLTDPAEAGRGGQHRRLSVQRLPELLSDSALRAEVEKRVAIAVLASDPLREHRNATIAHLDLDTSLGQRVTPLPPITRGELSKALARVTDVLQAIQLHYFESTMAYDTPVPFGPDMLFLVLRDGLRYDAERKARWERRDYRPEDQESPP